jgi:hypothetical protein
MTGYDDQTAMGGEQYRFPETQWTRLHTSGQREAIMVELYQRYWKPLYRFLRYRGWSNEKAKDMVQGFFTEKVLGQEFARKVDRSRGRLRNFLMFSLRNYALNLEEKDRFSQAISLEDVSHEPTTCQGLDEVFDRAWAESMLEDVLASLKQEYMHRGMPTYWDLFNEWFLEANAEKRDGSMKTLCNKYGIVSTNQAYKIVFKAKARFRSILREKLLQQVGSDQEVDLEIRKFIEIFSSC